MNAYEITYELQPIGTIPYARRVVVLCQYPDEARALAWAAEPNPIIIKSTKPLAYGTVLAIRQ